MSKLKVTITENSGSRNHPWYLTVFVNNVHINQKSFMSKQAAELGKQEYIEELFTDAVTKLLSISKIKLDTGVFCEKSYSIHGDRE